MKQERTIKSWALGLPGVGRLFRDRANPPADEVSQGAEEHWDRESQAEAFYWAEPPEVREHINQLITGVPWLFPTQALKSGWAYRPLSLGLSIGCGTGELERDLWRQRICRKIEAFDISRVSLRTAREAAKKEGMTGISYRREDFNHMKLRPNRYDIVFFHGSLHHATDPDRCLDEVEQALKPEGFLYIDEYVGPSKGEWQEQHLRAAREEYEKAPAGLRRLPLYPPIDPADPSEMVRSSRILPAIEERFDVVHYRPYWGNLLFPLFNCLDSVQLMRPENRGLVTAWIQKEKDLVERGEYSTPLFAVVLARRRATHSRR